MPNRGGFRSGQAGPSSNVPAVVTTDSRLSDTRLPPPSGVNAGSYGDSTHVGQFTVGADGRLTAAASVVINAGGLNPLTTLEVCDDFISGENTSGRLGALNWVAPNGHLSRAFGFDGSGLGTSGPGALEIDTNNVANAVCYLEMSPDDASGANIQMTTLFDVTFYLAWEGTDSTVKFRMGIANAWSVGPSEGAYIEKLETDTHFFGVTRHTGVQSRTASLGVDLSVSGDDVYHRVRIRRIDSGHIGFTIDGGTEVIATTNLPLYSGNVGIAIQANDTHFAAFIVDYVWLKITGMSR